MKRKTIIIIVIIIAVIGLGGVCIVSLLGPAIGNVYGNITEDVSATGEEFLQALKDADYDAAYDLLTPDVQEELGNPEALSFLFPPDSIDSWEYEADIVNPTSDTTGVAMTGTISMTDGSEVEMMLILVDVDGENLIEGYSFQSIE